jgi:hypothetical protein
MFISYRFKAKRKNFGSETKRNTLYQFHFGRKQKFVAKSSEKKNAGVCETHAKRISFHFEAKIFFGETFAL